MNMYQVNYADSVTGSSGFQLVKARNEDSARSSFYEYYLDWVEIISVDDCGPADQYTSSGVLDSSGVLVCY